MTFAAVVVAAALQGCGGGTAASDSAPTHPHAGEDVHYYDPDANPEDLSSDGDDDDDDDDDDGGDGGTDGGGGDSDGGPDGGDGRGDGGDDGGDGPSDSCTGPFTIDATGDSSAAAGRCEGEARLTRSGPDVVGELECEGRDALAPLGTFWTEVAGDAGGDGSLTLEFDTSGLRMVLYGSYDDTAVTLRGEDRSRIGDQNLVLVAEVSCLTAPD